MSKNFLLLTNLLVLGLGLSAFTGYCTVGEKPPFHLTTTSPGRTYEIAVDEDADISSDPVLTKHNHHEVHFAVTQDGRQIVKGESLYSGGTYDGRFQDLFPHHEWLSESVLRFGRTIKSEVPDEVTIYNETDRPVSYLVLKAGKYEMLLCVDVRPRSVVKLSVEAQNDQKQDLSYVGAKAAFVDGEKTPETGGNFRIRGKYVGAAHYDVRIKDGAILISSREFEPV